MPTILKSIAFEVKTAVVTFGNFEIIKFNF